VVVAGGEVVGPVYVGEAHAGGLGWELFAEAVGEASWEEGEGFEYYAMFRSFSRILARGEAGGAAWCASVHRARRILDSRSRMSWGLGSVGMAAAAKDYRGERRED
jgi:hypothetical protein